jgi:hypothetical protein
MVLEHFAKMHAIMGASHFELRCGLRPPRNGYERHEVALFRQEITADEFKSRFEAEESRPLDRELVQSFFDDKEDRLFWYSRVLQTVVEITHDQRSPDLWKTKEPWIERYLREMSLGSSLSSKRILEIYDLIEEVRVERQLRQAELGEYRAASAAQLIFTVLSQTQEAWKSCQDVAHRSQTDPRYAYATMASALFFREWDPKLPAPDDLHTLLSEEAALVRVALKQQEKAGAVSPTQAVQIINQVHVQPAPVYVAPHVPVPQAAENADRPRSRTRSNSPPADASAITPKLQNWAVGQDGRATWCLFHRRGDVWNERGRIAIPTGNQAILLGALAQNGGALSKNEARKLLAPAYRGKSDAELGQSITETLARIKKAIREAIAEASNCSVDLVKNPIPNYRPDWRAAIEIGYAVKADDGRLVFRTREQM